MEMQVSLDDGKTWTVVKSNVRVAYNDIFIPGEDENGSLYINLSVGGILTDVWVTRRSHGDHNIGTKCQLVDDIVDELVENNA